MININNILVVAAHPDDEVIGCGGFIAKQTQNGYPVHIVFMSNGVSSRELGDHKKLLNLILQRKENAIKASKILGAKSTKFLDFPDNSMDSVPLLNVAKELEKVVRKLNPSIIITHSKSDLNIDHRVTHEAVLISSRPKPGNEVQKIMFFEIPSSTNWNPTSPQFNPLEFVDVTEFINKKIDALNCYGSEICPTPHTRSLDGILALNKYRGTTVGKNLAEAFEIGRIVS